MESDTTRRLGLAERRGNDGWVYPDLVVEVAGPLACFTRPELKVERVSYPVMTPSAAAGVLEAIYWKPEFHYVVRAIEVLRPIEWTSIRRNEVKSAISATEVASLRKDPQRRYDVERDRDQRNTMLLRDVAYRIRAQVKPAAHSQDVSPAKYREQLRRRVDKGACFSQPFLGCREFSCSFGPATDAPTIDRDEELGVMLHSIIYPKHGQGGGEKYRWFRAQLISGVLKVPAKPLDDSQVALPGVGTRTSARGK